MEVLGYVSTIDLVQEELAAWMTISELSDIEDEIIQNDKLLLALLNSHLELFIIHGVHGLVESDWLLAEEALVPSLEDQEEANE